ncbi:MAG: Sir2 family NAD-dependent protein deacetylase [Bacteroidia bacterium]
MKKKLVVLTGAGISAESGLATFRDAGGLWEGHDVMQVASLDGWYLNPALVLEFYNMRRKAAQQAMPNAAHLGLASLEADYDVYIITQNVDDLHERAGSSKVMHLHGKLNEMRSSKDEFICAPYIQDIRLGDLAPDGSQWRPNIVWFGEAVPLMNQAASWVSEADIFVVIGTSLQVYPAAGLAFMAAPEIPKFLIDPAVEEGYNMSDFNIIRTKAAEGVEKLNEHLKNA